MPKSRWKIRNRFASEWLSGHTDAPDRLLYESHQWRGVVDEKWTSQLPRARPRWIPPLSAMRFRLRSRRTRRLFACSQATIRYDTIRDDILTCARKLTRVSLIHRTEPTSKNGKNRKTKKCSIVSVNSPGNPWSQCWRRKGRLRWEGFAEKRSLSLEY